MAAGCSLSGSVGTPAPLASTPTVSLRSGCGFGPDDSRLWALPEGRDTLRNPHAVVVQPPRSQAGRKVGNMEIEVGPSSQVPCPPRSAHAAEHGAI